MPDSNVCCFMLRKDIKLFNMKIKHRRFAALILLIFSLLNITSCRNENYELACFPDQYINVQLNLNLPAYYELNQKQWMYINEQSAGTRGLILVKSANSYLAFDRNAPHLCPDATTTLEVVDNIKIICPKDGAEWILSTGQPLKISNIPPKKYYTYYNASTGILTITN